ncbi:ATP-grasp domain-containing protein [Schinkia azotoformans]|uniref:ATP-grasp domain-containing protein n=1 Tax=Schinkia azotoformans TaxID=1454 RepID=UPI002DC02BE6|nr:ATP-grasp domain-containing protein [Schinkia azotoformans]MEC1747890.1 ATP-grasp domain-containing protein [Schinkia azotoformans]
MVKSKRLLILGAGRGQVGLIKTTKEMGIITIVGTMTNNNPLGIAFADEVCYMDISNPDEVLSKAKDLKLDGIATCCLDTGVTALGKSCEQLGLTGLKENAAMLCQDKLKMKTALMESGISTAKFFKVSSEDDLNESLQKLVLPVIIKATDLQGSKGIYIAHTEEEAYEGFRSSMLDTKRDYCIIEEFIEGWEFGAQSFVYNGEVLFVMPHGDDTFMSHTAIPVGHHVPLKCSEDIVRQTEECVSGAIKALGLDNCAVNVDLIVKGGKVYIIELTGRVGANCLPELVSINFGINYYQMIAAMALGDNPKNIWEKRNKKTTPGFAEMLFSEKVNGSLKKIEYTGSIDEDILEVTFFKEPGDQINAFESSNDCIGQVIVKGNTYEECKEKVEQIKKKIVMELI